MNRIRLAAAALIVVTAGVARAAPAGHAECLECHDQTKRGAVGLGDKALDMRAYQGSAHAKVTCVECHTDAKGDKCKAGLGPARCSSCHEKESARFAEGVHGRAKGEDGRALVTCASCHGTHDTLSKKNAKSNVYPTEQAKTCARCHDGKSARTGEKKRAGFRLSDYEKSAHWLGITQDGLTVSATCGSCHGGHDMRGKDDPKSNVARANLPKTCGSCHEGLTEKYYAGVHGQALLRGSADTPICTDCHGDHATRSKKDPESSVYATRVSKMTCPQCHGAEYINRKYGLATGQITSYRDTFHGLSDQMGDPKVANCASCHQAHDILPSSNPKSAVHAANLPATCGSCHPGAGPNFAKGSAHSPAAEGAAGGATVKWVRWVYLGIIGVSLGAMALHNGLDYYAALRERHRESKRQRRFVRFDLGERLQHAMLVMTFAVLVFTGFALRYPNAFWVEPFVQSGLGFLVRGYAHRVAAVIFVVASLYHAYYLFLTRRGREQLRAMRPGKSDLGELVHQLRYYVGLEPKPARFGRYGYVEKFEYLALIWGSFVMIVTGLVLWFEEGALAWLPKWGWDVADVIHLYEAWLASLSILIWHLYHVAFKPSGHGVSMVMATGELTLEEMKHEHPRELDTLPASSSIEPTNEGEEAEEASHEPVLAKP